MEYRARSIVVLAFVVTGWLWLGSACTGAHAHSWYPLFCCSEQDCRPVPCDELAEGRDGRLIYLPTGNRFEPAQVQPSQDSSCHICVGRYDGRSICAFTVQGS